MSYVIAIERFRVGLSGRPMLASVDQRPHELRAHPADRGVTAKGPLLHMVDVPLRRKRGERLLRERSVLPTRTAGSSSTEPARTPVRLPFTPGD
ncbi:hypothetical protein DFJ69_6042 [Thermomonospora umbrina]|uniref:Uncharacterized protein n=1 Tax=Thermomonospora umbrina TaxID=111806 RepID=A0A3D9SY56_9ACTN|nr:hypothetical protein DFJ69_6042 [Thermomonospora umbrina]